MALTKGFLKDPEKAKFWKAFLEADTIAKTAMPNWMKWELDSNAANGKRNRMAFRWSMEAALNC